jgi:carboxymethylenebutenolidase
VASYGSLDSSLKGDAERLKGVLSKANVPHDIKVYEGVGHGFMNLHSDEEMGWVFKFLGGLVHTKYDEPATLDARARIAAFFHQHLREDPRPAG